VVAEVARCKKTLERVNGTASSGAPCMVPLPHTEDDQGRGVFALVPRRELSIRLSPPGFGRAPPSSSDSLDLVRIRGHRLFRTLSHTEGRVVGIVVSLGMVWILALMGLRWLG